MELTYMDYMKYIEDVFKEETIREMVKNIRPSGSFVMMCGNRWEAVNYAGYTLITPSGGEDTGNENAYGKLLKIKKCLSGYIDFAKCVEAPGRALHMTVARLISGKTYEASWSEDFEGRLLNRFAELFSNCTVTVRPRFEIRGISIFPNGIVAAMVSPVLAGDYQNLQKFRDVIYNDGPLAELGVERKRKFIGHVTLFYIEKELDAAGQLHLAEGVLSINDQFFGEPVPFVIRRAEVRRFENFLHFGRQEDWPGFDFI